ncbi:MAG TPA: hypothetical protein VLJ61_02750 [Pyrinomonadaceae bacterium]|nr:hypothetical protein [Pyrinomonadaceae bacterium]
MALGLIGVILSSLISKKNAGEWACPPLVPALLKRTGGATSSDFLCSVVTERDYTRVLRARQKRALAEMKRRAKAIVLSRAV